MGIAYIYFNFRQQDDQKIDNLMASLLKQLARSHCFPESVKDLYNRHEKNQTRPSVDEISQALQSVAKTYSKVFIIVDALDECQSFNDCGLKLLSYIFDLQANTATNFFATSRLIPDIEGQFKTHLKREILATNEDVRIYLEGHLSDLPKCILNRPDIQEKVKTEIASAVDGMFLLAQLYLNSIKDKTSPKQVKSALEQFKKQSQLELGEDKKREIWEKAYEQAMDRINSQMPGFRVLVRKVLAWIICAKRKLITSELQHALAVETGSSGLDRDNLPEIEDMVSACAGLVTVDKESNIIRLVHYTAQEYFDRTRQDWFPDAEADITEICVTCISFSVFESGCCPINDELQARLRLTPLYNYAAHNWGYHTRATPEKQLILDFLESEAKASASSQVLLMGPKQWMAWKQHGQVDGGMIGVHLAAYFGLTCIASLLKNGHDAGARDSNGRTPLWWAIDNEHEAIVRLLLENGADIETKDQHMDRGTPLLQATEKGHEAIVRLLLEKGADIKAKDYSRQTPLRMAAKNGHEAIVRLLLERDADVEARDYGNQTALSLARKNRHQAIVQLLLLRHDTRVRAEYCNGWTSGHNVTFSARRDWCTMEERPRCTGPEFEGALRFPS
ncbi:hypothetical protein ACHAPE_002638 [Trichoderma viride]